MVRVSLKAAIEELLQRTSADEEAADEEQDDYDADVDEEDAWKLMPRPRKVGNEDWQLYRAIGELPAVLQLAKANMRGSIPSPKVWREL